MTTSQTSLKGNTNVTIAHFLFLFAQKVVLETQPRNKTGGESYTVDK